tara:strand:+ start:1036 stop:1941 length:906 start_codon:yes stop_codon:yes gene_type:complete
MRFLVTGGAGFIGSNIVDTLLHYPNNVACIDNESADSNSEFYWNKNAKNYPIDINDYDALKWVFKHEKPEVVFHTAAEARIQPTIDEPQKACLTNFVGTCNVLQACREFGARRLIYSSTSSAYGLKNIPPLQEDMPRDCLNPYSVSKSAGEDLCKVYYKIYGIETVILRYFNVYGNREPTEGQYAPVIGLFLRQKREGLPMTIVGDGKQTRDFTNVKDVVDANILAALGSSKELLGEVLNIGTGRSYSILEISQMIGGKTAHLPERLGEARETLADNSKAKKLMGWEPKVDLKSYLKNLDF